MINSSDKKQLDSFNYLQDDDDDHHQLLLEPNIEDDNNNPNDYNKSYFINFGKIKDHHFQKCQCCSWKCFCLSSWITFSLFIIIISIIFYVSILPNFAQSTLNNASMDIINGTLYDPTQSTISLNTTIMLSNTGMFDGLLHSVEVNVYSNDIKIGSMLMAPMKTKANMNNVISMNSILKIENITEFQRSCKELLRNRDQTWILSANRVKLTVSTGFIGSFEFELNINKELILPGANLYNFIASSFNVNSATTHTISTSSDMNFISNSLFTFSLPSMLMEVYINNTYIGYAPLNEIVMKPGYNIINSQLLVIESYPNNSNRDVLSIFFSEYIMNNNQRVLMKGPVASARFNYPPLVIDGILEEIIIALGYSTSGTYGNEGLAFGGLITSKTEDGWKVSTTGERVRGAYTNMINPLNVSMRILNMSSNSYLKESIKYDVTLLLVDKYECPETTYFGHLRLGQGIYKNNSTKTFVDVDANSKATFFTIAEPMKEEEEKEDSCLGVVPFSCCFATLTTAYICKLNPSLHKDKSAQLDKAYLPLELDSNITMLLDGKFNITTYYKQSFFPLFYGYEVYAGTISDGEISCSDFKFY